MEIRVVWGSTSFLGSVMQKILAHRDVDWRKIPFSLINRQSKSFYFAHLYRLDLRSSQEAMKFVVRIKIISGDFPDWVNAGGDSEDRARGVECAEAAVRTTHEAVINEVLVRKVP